MNIQQALQQAVEQLSDANTAHDHDLASLDTQLLLSHVLQCNRAHLLAWPEKDLEQSKQQQFFQLVQQRAEGLPIAHLVGSREFWSLDFKVDSSTLIPRPETETLVEYILQKHGGRQSLKLLDMGTGTGAIAISIASEKPDWDITASDLSAPALALAEDNRQRHQATNVSLVESNWFDNIETNDFDIIVSNPPYIAEGDPHLDQGDVRFEPATALTSGTGGMDDIEYICLHAGGYLKKHGQLIIEHGFDQQQAVADCFARNGYTEIEQEKDLSGHIRMTAGKYG